MRTAESGLDAARRQLERVLASAGFSRNERLTRFLRFVVERHLDSKDGDIKESVIAIEVFGRKTDHDPKQDSIVRTEAARLRARLNEYYLGEGKSDAVVIELPKGGYVPVVRCAGERETIAPSPNDVAAVRGKRRSVGFACAGLTVLLAVAGLIRFGSSRQPPNTSSGAYDLYLRARHFQLLPNVTGIESSIDLFRQAITKDPSFAPAYAGMAAGYAARSGFDGFDEAQRAEMFANGWAAAEKAVQLDPLSADALDALGMMQALQAQWELAERSFRRAIELSPRDHLWRAHFATFLLLPLGRIEDAIGELRAAEELDPLSPQIHSALTVALRSVGRFDEAFFHCQKAAENDQRRSSCWAENLLRQGKTDEAVRMLETVWSGHLMEPGAQAVGVAYAKAGRREDAERVAALVPRLASKAYIFAALGDKDRTFEVLDRMVPMGPVRIGRDFLISPNFAFLRGDPRWTALRRRVGLTE